jgi:hypothetical protein
MVDVMARVFFINFVYAVQKSIWHFLTQSDL